MRIRDAEPADLPRVRALIDEYCRWLAIDLRFQDIEAELDGLPGAYAPPSGALLVGLVDEVPQGLIASRPRGPGISEIKRLYVTPAARGLGLARALVEAIVARAVARGDRQLVLDTLPMMADAQRLYESLGFRDIDPYYPSPIAGTRFMALGLPYN